MKIYLFIFAALFLSCSSEDPYKSLTKLSGTWTVSDGEGGAYEEWSKSKGDSMIGRAFKINGKDTLVSERITLKKADEHVWYIPRVAGQNNDQPIPFKLISFNDSSYTFENKSHDFPQRVIYKFIHDDSIVATIEGLDSNKSRNVRRFFDYYLSRVQ